jgi:hypothetical protein
MSNIQEGMNPVAPMPESQPAQQAEPLGKVEQMPNNPEIRTGTVKLPIFIASDGSVFTSLDSVNGYNQALKESQQPGR